MLKKGVVTRLFSFAVLSATLSGLVLMSGEQADAAPAFQYTGRVCIAVPEMLALSSALSDATLKALGQQDATITVADGGADYLLQYPSLTVTSVEKPASVSPNACRTTPQNMRLRNAGAVKASYIQAFKEVMRYRATHSWPIGGVSTNPAQVDVFAARYGPYVTIGLVDNFAHRTACGKFILGCEGDESYRVRTSASEVLPFEGCVENPNRNLPSLSQLPP